MVYRNYIELVAWVLRFANNFFRYEVYTFISVINGARLCFVTGLIRSPILFSERSMAVRRSRPMWLLRSPPKTLRYQLLFPLQRWQTLRPTGSLNLSKKQILLHQRQASSSLTLIAGLNLTARWAEYHSLSKPRALWEPVAHRKPVRLLARQVACRPRCRI